MTSTGGPARRRRRRRQGRGGDAKEASPRSASQVQRPTSSRPDWRWLTFPVFAAFASGGFLILLIAPETNTLLYTVLFFGFLTAVAFAGAHIASRWLLSRRRG